MLVIFGTVVRNAPVRKGGELVVLDWDRKQVLDTVPIVPDRPSLDHDPNPRGNSRGCRGVAVVDGQILATNYHTLMVFDGDVLGAGPDSQKSLSHKRDISHGLMAGLHEIDVVGNVVWVTSTALDAALKYDLDSGALVDAFWPREMPAFQANLDLGPRAVDPAADYRSRLLAGEHLKDPHHLHLNAVVEQDGQVYALLNRFGAIVNLSAGTVVAKDPRLKGGHNLMFIDADTVVANDTRGRTVRFYDIGSGDLVRTIDLLEFRPVQNLNRWATATNLVRRALNKSGLQRVASIARPLFVRGLHRRGDSLFVGLSPASVLEISLESGELVDWFRYALDVEVCVHGLYVVERRSKTLT